VGALGALLAAGTVAAAGPAAASCQGGTAGPVKPVVHALEEPVSGTPGETAVHAVECVLP
jgi:hypothetical protein